MFRGGREGEVLRFFGLEGEAYCEAKDEGEEEDGDGEDEEGEGSFGEVEVAAFGGEEGREAELDWI